MIFLTQAPNAVVNPIDRNSGYGQAEIAIAAAPGEKVTAGSKEDSFSSTFRENGLARETLRQGDPESIAPLGLGPKDLGREVPRK